MDMVNMLNLILVVILVVILLLGIIAVLLYVKIRNKKAPKDETIQIKQPEQKNNLITRDGKEIDSTAFFSSSDNKS